MDRHGFTLIELLVVITIIVVLLALLVPALDKAIYQAELAVCAAQIRAVATGLQTYAVDHRRSYIHRQGLGDGGWDVSILRPGLSAGIFAGGAQLGDLRPQLRPYVALNKHLLDPFVDPVDIEGSMDESYTYGSYHIFAGWRYVNSAGMMRLGDRFSWQGERYSAFVADADHFNGEEYAMTSHPDDEGRLQNRVFQDRDQITGAALGIPGAANATFSWFDREAFAAAPSRGRIDRNVGFTDGAVERFEKVPRVNPGGLVQDPTRWANVPWTHDGRGVGDWPNYGIQVPRK